MNRENKNKNIKRKQNSYTKIKICNTQYSRNIEKTHEKKNYIYNNL